MNLDAPFRFTLRTLFGVVLISSLVFLGVHYLVAEQRCISVDDLSRIGKGSTYAELGSALYVNRARLWEDRGDVGVYACKICGEDAYAVIRLNEPETHVAAIEIVPELPARMFSSTLKKQVGPRPPGGGDRRIWIEGED